MTFIKKISIYLFAFTGIAFFAFLLSSGNSVFAEEPTTAVTAETELTDISDVTLTNENNTSETDIPIADATETPTAASVTVSKSTTAPTPTTAAYKRQSVKLKSVKIKKLNAIIKWQKMKDAKKYEVFLFKNNKWKKIKTTFSTKFTIKNLENCNTYSVRVRAIVKTPYGTDYSYFSEIKDFEINQTKLYSLSNASLFDRKKKVKRQSVSGYYTGYESGKYKGYIIIDYNYGTYLVKKSKVKTVKSAKVLSTSAVSQIYGSYRGWSACGPATVTILLNSEKKANVHKDELVRTAKRKHLEDQGSVTKNGGGMTSTKLIKLIKYFGYNAKNLYKSSVKPSKIIKKQIDLRKRCLILVKYSGGIMPDSGAAHFVVVCGYKKIGGKLYFYYADPYYNFSGGRSILSVSSSLLNRSVSRKFSEPNTILILE